MKILDFFFDAKWFKKLLIVHNIHRIIMEGKMFTNFTNEARNLIIAAHEEMLY